MLYLAVRHGLAECARMLLEKGADPTIAVRRNDWFSGCVVTVPYDSWKSRKKRYSPDVDYAALGALLTQKASDKFTNSRKERSSSGESTEKRSPIYVLNPQRFFQGRDDGGALQLAYTNGGEDDLGSYLNIKKIFQYEKKIPDHVLRFNDDTHEIRCYAGLSQIRSTPILVNFLTYLGYCQTGNSHLQAKRFVDSEFAHSTLLERLSPLEAEKKSEATAQDDVRVLREEAEEFFKNRKDLPKSKKCGPKSFDDLLNNNFCVGEAHQDAAPKRFLIENMSIFSQRGYKTLFMEHLFYDSALQDSLDDYFKGLEMTEDLRDYLVKMNIGHMSKFGAGEDINPDYNFLTLVQSAKENGIRIVGIDTNESYQMGKSEYGASGAARMMGMNYVAPKIINKEAKKEKWFALMGNTHLGTSCGIEGVAEILNVATVDIYTEKDLGDNSYDFQGTVREILGEELLGDVRIKCADGKSLSLSSMLTTGDTLDAKDDESITSEEDIPQVNVAPAATEISPTIGLESQAAPKPSVKNDLETEHANEKTLLTSLKLTTGDTLNPDLSLEPFRISLSLDSHGLERAPHRKHSMHTAMGHSAERGHENQGLVEIMDDSNDGSGLNAKYDEDLFPDDVSIVSRKDNLKVELAPAATKISPTIGLESQAAPKPSVKNPKAVPLFKLRKYTTKSESSVFFQGGEDGRGNKLRVVCDKDGKPIYKNKEAVEQALKDVILLAAEEYKINNKEMKFIVEYARLAGGFSHQFSTEGGKEGSYTKGGDGLESYIQEKLNLDELEAAAKAKTWRKFSREIQNKNTEIGIYSGREENLKTPVVGLRAAFALDLVGDDIVSNKRVDQRLKERFEKRSKNTYTAKNSRTPEELAQIR